MLTYRPVVMADLTTIVTFPQTVDELYYCCPKADFPLTIEQLALIISQRKNSTVVEKNGIIAGLANFYYWQNNGCCKIGNVIINPGFRQQGIASYLIDVMQQQAKEQFNATELQVSCFNLNTAALLLYHKIGFSPVGIEERIDKQEQKIALIHLSKRL